MKQDLLAPGSGIVVLGATSAIARAAAIELARAGCRIVLAARDIEENERVAADIRVRCGVEVAALPFDAEDFNAHSTFVQACRDALGEGVDGVLLCFGHLVPQADAQKDFALARKTIDTNYVAAVSILEHFARHFENRRRGFIAAVSSVAGDRGRQSNYLYGSAKAGLSAYLQGLRNRMYHCGVHVLTVKPGFIDTKMTFGLPNLFLVASSEQCGRDIVDAVRRGRNEIYTPWFWRVIMLIIRHVPEWQFKRMRL